MSLADQYRSEAVVYLAAREIVRAGSNLRSARVMDGMSKDESRFMMRGLFFEIDCFNHGNGD